MICKICQHKTKKEFSHLVLNKYMADFQFCPNCNFLFAANPSWLEEAYTHSIANTDIGLLQRNTDLARKIGFFLYLTGNAQGQSLDTGGGYGVFVRLMRDLGIDFYWDDPFSKNLFAQGFEKIATQKKYSSITFFEVFEHLENPLQYIQNLISNYEFDMLIFSTEVYNDKPPTPTSWWYYTFHTGQHISFCNAKTLQIIANLTSTTLYSHKGIHILSKKPLNKLLIRIAFSKFSKIIFPLIKPFIPSKSEEDYKKLLKNR